MSRLRDRLQRFVEVVFDGNAFAASKATGLGPSTLHRILEGKVTEPRMATMQLLADAMGVPAGWLLGEISSERAQMTAHPLPEAYWLIMAFYRRSQRLARSRIERATAPTAEAKKLIQHFQDFRISPFDGFPAPLFEHQLLERKQPSARDLALVRSCMKLETEALDYAVLCLRNMGSRFQTEVDDQGR